MIPSTIRLLSTCCLLLASAVAMANEVNLPKRQINGELARLNPTELLAVAGSGLYFRHDIPGVSLSHPATHAWWEKPSSLLSTSLHLSAVRGSERIDITIPDYRGPGSYQRGDFAVTLRRGDQTWSSVSGKAQTLVVQAEKDGWINGFFNAVMSTGDEEALHRLSNGIFRLNSDKSPVVAIFENE